MQMEFMWSAASAMPSRSWMFHAHQLFAHPILLTSALVKDMKNGLFSCSKFFSFDGFTLFNFVSLFFPYLSILVLLGATFHRARGSATTGTTIAKWVLMVAMQTASMNSVAIAVQARGVPSNTSRVPLKWNLVHLVLSIREKFRGPNLRIPSA